MVVEIFQTLYPFKFYIAKLFQCFFINKWQNIFGGLSFECSQLFFELKPKQIAIIYLLARNLRMLEGNTLNNQFVLLADSQSEIELIRLLVNNLFVDVFGRTENIAVSEIDELIVQFQPFFRWACINILYSILYLLLTQNLIVCFNLLYHLVYLIHDHSEISLFMVECFVILFEFGKILCLSQFILLLFTQVRTLLQYQFFNITRTLQILDLGVPIKKARNGGVADQLLRPKLLQLLLFLLTLQHLKKAFMDFVGQVHKEYDRCSLFNPSPSSQQQLIAERSVVQMIEHFLSNNIWAKYKRSVVFIGVQKFLLIGNKFIQYQAFLKWFYCLFSQIGAKDILLSVLWKLQINNRFPQGR